MPSLNLFDPGVFEAKATVYMSDRLLSPWGLAEVTTLWPVLDKS